MSKTPQICVALDGMGLLPSIEMAEKLQGRVWGFKVGDLLTEYGSSTVINNLRDKGKVFADLKFFDIPNTVFNHCQRLVRVDPFGQGADIISVHATGGREMMEQAVRATRDTTCQIAAITVLTSFTSQNLLSSYNITDRAGQVLRLRNLAAQAGCQALVCSAPDLEAMDGMGRGSLFTIIPGIRPTNFQVAGDDQQYTAAKYPPGADLLVVGRPITQAADPVAALTRLLGELHVG